MKAENMKTKMMLVAGIVLISSFSAQAGREGHGGIAKVCIDPTSGKETTELLDIYEGRRLGVEFKKVDSLLSLPGMFDGAIPDQAYVNIINAIKLVRQRTVELKEPSDFLVLTQDAQPIIDSKNCKTVQVANFWSDGRLYIDPVIFNKMDVLNQAATTLHEAVYYLLRKYHDIDDSYLAREFVREILRVKTDYKMGTALYNHAAKYFVTSRSYVLKNNWTGELPILVLRKEQDEGMISCGNSLDLFERLIECSTAYKGDFSFLISMGSFQRWEVAGNYVYPSADGYPIDSELVFHQKKHYVSMKLHHGSIGHARLACEDLSVKYQRKYKVIEEKQLNEAADYLDKDLLSRQDFKMFRNPFVVEASVANDRSGKSLVAQMNNMNRTEVSIEAKRKWKKIKFAPKQTICVGDLK
ncbi:MAG: hypothetical protein KA715_09765 [Xanthomonadaceae bacterium]|nr:hypothetical protein [Xanthomonadaceae bacterium]